MPKEFTRRAHDTFSAVPSHPSSRLNLPGMLRQAWIFNPTLTIFTILSALLTIVGAVGMLVDPRIVLGMPTWAKSTKFGISLALYGATLLWMLPMIKRWPRQVQFVAHASGRILILEIVLLGVLLLRRRTGRLTDGHRLALVCVGAASYTGLVALVTWQALRDQPLLAPDALTLGVLGALIAATTALVGGVLMHAHSRAHVPSVAQHMAL